MNTNISRLSLSACLLAATLAIAACASAPEQKPAPAAEATKPALPKDAALAANVKTALDSDAELAKFNLAVTGKGEDVTIEGATDTGLQMAQAGIIAEKVPGVRYVMNNIQPRD
ncbi:BON domain-containing protein [Chitiniphilus eburneus]|uniref:BON domain-containing protein n=1 Tax=Chitiniphilus eburneus TaxID=2571148 RepID=A0A4U0QN96_9NEIS|nr:BON domain-containing protein [Chitiniphilus eburneus]TJZ77594.1 BON domain-containing protein [Chitiniphilus eburneus]